MEEKRLEGRLIIIGGAEDKKGEKVILKKVCSNIDMDKDELVVVTVATEYPKEVGEEYRQIFNRLGVKKVSILHVLEREDAYEPNNIEILKRASLVFFTGGDQLRITSVLGGSPLYNTLKEINSTGVVIVGTSAGASVMSDCMIVSGLNDDSPRKCTIKMAPGLSLIKGVIIDQHFAQRGRIGRLLGAIAENPQWLGIGIDEDTSIDVSKEGYFKTIGSGAVYVIDGSTISNSNVSEQYQDRVLSIFDVKIHVLKNNDSFSLINRRPYRGEEGKNEDKAH